MPRRLEHWLYAYQEYTEGTESPESFHLWCGLATIAAAAQRKIWFRLGRLTIHSNMFVVLTGPSGGPRKSTAMGYAREILEDAMDWGVKFEIAPQKVSGASLISRMTRIQNPEHQSLTAYASELGSFIGEGTTDVTAVLTDLWDCRKNWDKETVSRGSEKITAPWLNVIAATTPTWLGDNLPKTAVEGGFVSRALFIYEESRPQRVAIPEMTEHQEELKRLLAHDLADIAMAKGMMQFSPTARDYYTEWYENEENFRPSADARLKTFYERKQDNAIKVAMALSLARSSELIVDTKDIAAAIAVVSEVEKSMSNAFQGVGRNIYSMDHERIKRQILGAGPQGIPYKHIVGTNIHSIDKEQIDKILVTLQQMDIVVIKDQVLKAKR